MVLSSQPGKAGVKNNATETTETKNMAAPAAAAQAPAEQYPSEKKDTPIIKLFDKDNHTGPDFEEV